MSLLTILHAPQKVKTPEHAIIIGINEEFMMLIISQISHCRKPRANARAELMKQQQDPS